MQIWIQMAFNCISTSIPPYSNAVIRRVNTNSSFEDGHSVCLHVCVNSDFLGFVNTWMLNPPGLTIFWEVWKQLSAMTLSSKSWSGKENDPNLIHDIKKQRNISWILHKKQDLARKKKTVSWKTLKCSVELTGVASLNHLMSFLCDMNAVCNTVCRYVCNVFIACTLLSAPEQTPASPPAQLICGQMEISKSTTSYYLICRLQLKLLFKTWLLDGTCVAAPQLFIIEIRQCGEVCRGWKDQINFSLTLCSAMSLQLQYVTQNVV